MTSAEGASGRPAAASDGDVGLSLLTLGSAVLRARRGIVVLTAACCVAVGAATLLARPTYTLLCSFMPQSRRPEVGAGLAGIAAQFGVSVPGGEGALGPNFYVALLRSRTLLEGVVDGVYTWTEEGRARRGTLADAFESRGNTPAVRRENAIEELAKRLTPAVNAKSGLVTFTVKTYAPELSAAIAQATLERVNAFNVRTRQGQASAERRFAEQRLAEVRQEVRGVEAQLERFLRENRVYAAPELQFQRDRLANELGVRQQVYTTLAQAAEQAKIEEVRDIPVITVVEAPQVPVRRDPRGTVVKVLLTGVVALLTAVLAVVVSALVRPQGAHDPNEWHEWSTLRAEARRDLRRPWRLFAAGERPAS